MSKIYDNVLEKLSNSRKVFVPNLTSKLSFLAACENLQKGEKFLFKSIKNINLTSKKDLMTVKGINEKIALKI